MGPPAPQPPPDGLADDLVGDHASIRGLRERIAAVAPTGSTVLLTGETGTGKGLVARLLHARSRRKENPFVHVDCGTLAPNVIESELFGHERGAFTGALERRPGRFERAGRGTVFLDEVGELGPELQAKLLRVLHDREYERIGGTRTLRMEARIVAATSRHLQAEVRSGRFRRDLYFRLAVVELHVPALRERAQDLPALIRFGVQRLARQLGVAAPPVTPGFCELLRAHTWPGNVRELFNLLERLLAEGSDRLDASRLAGFAPRLGGRLQSPDCGAGCALATPPEPKRAASGAREDLERIAATLVETGGNVARTARRLGLPRSTLRHRIERHGLAHLIPRD